MPRPFCFVNRDGKEHCPSRPGPSLPPPPPAQPRARRDRGDPFRRSGGFPTFNFQARLIMIYGNIGATS